MQMMGWIGIAIAAVSLIVSVTTLWLTNFRRGRLRMTMPTVFAFRYDTIPKQIPKVFLRALIHCTSAQGQVIEGMYARVQTGEGTFDFSTWGYTEGQTLFSGSGVFVSKAGLAAYHHFLLPVQEGYRFGAGDYQITIYARVLGRKSPIHLAELSLQLTEDDVFALFADKGVLFERRLDGHYESHIVD